MHFARKLLFPLQILGSLALNITSPHQHHYHVKTERHTTHSLYMRLKTNAPSSCSSRTVEWRETGGEIHRQKVSRYNHINIYISL
uniref:Secreted protein n=1 Tax=Monopterus albus TaxID=43700 RepID=A0A3Q3J8M5_MONAL